MRDICVRDVPNCKPFVESLFMRMRDISVRDVPKCKPVL